jgi:hypothetical protein
MQSALSRPRCCALIFRAAFCPILVLLLPPSYTPVDHVAITYLGAQHIGRQRVTIFSGKGGKLQTCLGLLAHPCTRLLLPYFLLDDVLFCTSAHILQCTCICFENVAIHDRVLKTCFTEFVQPATVKARARFD